MAFQKQARMTLRASPFFVLPNELLLLLLEFCFCPVLLNTFPHIGALVEQHKHSLFRKIQGHLSQTESEIPNYVNWLIGMGDEREFHYQPTSDMQRVFPDLDEKTLYETLLSPSFVPLSGHHRRGEYSEETYEGMGFMFCGASLVFVVYDASCDTSGWG